MNGLRFKFNIPMLNLLCLRSAFVISQIIIWCHRHAPWWQQTISRYFLMCDPLSKKPASPAFCENRTRNFSIYQCLMKNGSVWLLSSRVIEQNASLTQNTTFWRCYGKLRIHLADFKCFKVCVQGWSNKAWGCVMHKADSIIASFKCAHIKARKASKVCYKCIWLFRSHDLPVSSSLYRLYSSKVRLRNSLWYSASPLWHSGAIIWVQLESDLG